MRGKALRAMPAPLTSNPSPPFGGRGEDEQKESLVEEAQSPVESPSLSAPGNGEGPAFEMKFLVDEPLARVMQECVCERLPLDAHGDPQLEGAYRTSTLYLDTEQLDVYRRTEGFKRRKYRIRRYGDEPWIFLERKKRTADRVRKKRTPVPLEELAVLANPLSVNTWPGNWFHQRLLDHGFRPACLVGYQRTAFAGNTTEGPARLTLDRGLRGSLAREWNVPPAEGGLSLLTGQAILEFKFRTALPALFKELIQEFRLTPGAVSKYRHCLLAWGIAEAPREVADA